MASKHKSEELSESTKQFHAAAMMRVKDLFSDSLSETGETLTDTLKGNLTSVITGIHKTF